MKTWPASWAPKPNISNKSLNDYNRCPRRYWYANGPKEELPRWAIVQQKLLPWPAYAGQVVDDAIKSAALEYRETGAWPDDLRERGADLLRVYWRETRDYREVTDANKPAGFGGRSPVDRVYYGDEVPKDERALVREKVETSLDAFLTCGIREFLSHYPRESLMLTKPVSEEPIPWYRLSEVPIYASFDLAVRTEDATVIVDWKTGKRNAWSENRTIDQLHVYAQFAMTVWKSPAESVSLIPVWLGEGGNWSASGVDQARLAELNDMMRQRHELLAAKWRACDRSPRAAETEFPMTDRTATCRDCVFRSCPGYTGGLTDATGAETETDDV